MKVLYITLLLHYPVVSFLTMLLLKVLLKDLRIIAMVVISFIEKLREESLIKIYHCELLADLQCTSMGPLEGFTWAFIRRM